MRKSAFILLSAAIALAALACSSPSSAPPPEIRTPSVNVAGFIQNVDNQCFPCLWNDGTGTELETEPGSGVYYGTAVSDGIAYVSGGFRGVACYWACRLVPAAEGAVTADRVDLPQSGSNGALAQSVFVDGNTVYLAGYEYNASYAGRACYWTHIIGSTDAVQHFLTDGSADAQVGAVYFRNGTLYMAGYYTNASGDRVACYWTDSGQSAVPLIVSDYDSEARSVFVDDAGTVYTAGYRSAGEEEDDMIACYWVGPGDRSVDLSASASDAAGILVDAGSVYVSGNDYVTADGLNRACYWTDSATADLEDPERVLLDSGPTQSYAGSHCLTDSKIYVPGCYISGGGKTVAAYWTDSLSEDSAEPVRVPLSDASTDAMAWSLDIGYVSNSADG